MKYKKYFRKTSLKQKGHGDFLLDEVKKEKPKIFLEIGVFHGVTARNVCELLNSLHGNEFKYETKEVKTPAQVATELSTLLDASALISSSIGGTVITITSAASGTGFSVGSSLSSNTNVTISDPTTIQGTGKFAIFGEPKFSSVATGTQEVYNYCLLYTSPSPRDS